jgi:hypothetical protein
MNFIEAVTFCVVQSELSLTQLFVQLNVPHTPKQRYS